MYRNSPSCRAGWIVIAALSAASLLGSNASPVLAGGQVRVPDVKNLMPLDAQTALESVGLKSQISGVNSTADPRKSGIVFDQSLKAGSLVNRGATVSLSIYFLNLKLFNPGATNHTVEVPWIINKSRRQAEARLWRRGLFPEAVAGNATNNAGQYDRVYQQSTNGGKVIKWPGSVKYTYLTSKAPPGPVDANSADLLPNLIPFANADDSFDIAWCRRDGKVYLSHYTGRSWSQNSHIAIPNALDMVSGFVKDNQGNSYIATMRHEYAPKWRWDEGYAPNVAHILKVPAGGRSAQLLADLNQKSFVRSPIINPSNTQSAFRTTARMAMGNGAMALAFDHNHGAWNNVHNTSVLTAVGVDGASRYDRGGSQHCMDLRLMFDGKDFIMAQAFEGGIGLSKLRSDSNPMRWSGHILVFENKFGNGGYLRMAGIANTNNGYLVVCAFGQGQLNSSNNVEWNGIRPAQPLYAVTAPRNFDAEPTYDRKRNPNVARGAAKKLLIRPATDKSVFVRPKLVDLKNGKYIVICEQRRYSRGNGYENTQAVLIDGTGRILRGPVTHNNCPTQMSNDAFLLPRSRLAAWVSGDAANGRIMLYTLDESLRLNTYPLSIPR